MKSNVGKLLSTAAIAATISAGATAATLDEIKAKGFVQCGVSQGVPGFSNADVNGEWSGIDVDACRATAAAIFGDAQKVKFTPLSAKERFTALQSGEIDMLSRNTTWTYTRDASLGLDFTAVNFYDGQGFMVRKDLGIDSAKDLDGATVCTEQGTTTELNMADFFRKNQLSYVPVVVQKADEALSAYASGRCDVFTTDKSGLAAHRSKLANPDQHVILDDTISKEPLGPVVRHGDNQWKDIVTWALFVQVNAEEMGISFKDLHFKAGIFGAEPWSEDMRTEIEQKLNMDALDIYGLSEVMGPGVSIACLEAKKGLHIFEDHFIPEIINPNTGDALPYGDSGELVFTTITKEAFPIIRYRTRDITTLNPEPCICGRTHVRMNKVSGRTDDMLIIRGVNVFPSQIESVLMQAQEVEPHYQLIVDRKDNLDTLTVRVEIGENLFSDEVKQLQELEKKISKDIKETLGVSAKVKLAEPKSIARSEGKATRVIDNRKI